MTKKELFVLKIFNSVIYIVYKTFTRIDFEGWPEDSIYVVENNFFSNLKQIPKYKDNKYIETVYIMNKIDFEKDEKDFYIYFNREFRKSPVVDIIKIRDMKYEYFVKYFIKLEKVWEQVHMES